MDINTQKKEYKLNNVVKKDKSDRLMEGIGAWGAHYRYRPDLFVKEYLQLNLYLFQKILLILMMQNTHMILCAARGLGKTYLTALFCCVKCILYPGTKICVCSKTLKQAKDIIKKIQLELKPRSPILAAEIKNITLNGVEGIVSFYNNSFIYITTASENARGGRCNLLIIDEYRMVDKTIVDMVLKKFLNVKRMPGYLSKEPYKNDPKYDEENCEIYMSSCWLKSCWGWDLVKDYAKNMTNDSKKYCVCGLPYQLAIKEGMLLRSQLEDEMSEGSFNSILFSMEMECLWYGESTDAFFQYEDLISIQHLKQPLYTSDVLALTKLVSNPKKEKNEIRFASMDVAVMPGKKNDASSIFIWRLIPNKSGQFARYVVYGETFEGMHSEDQTIRLRYLMEEFDCDYVVVDKTGVGLTITENLVKDLTDKVTGKTYPAISCMNNDAIASHYKGSSRCPKKILYVVNGSETGNTRYALKLKDAIKVGKIQFLISHKDFKEEMAGNKEFFDLPEEIKAKIEFPYLETAFTIGELSKVKKVVKNGNISVVEGSTERKDRYSSLAYGNDFVDYLEDKKKGKHTQERKRSFIGSIPEFLKRQ